MNNILPDNQESPQFHRSLGGKKNTPRSINLESPCNCGNLTGKLGAGKKPGEASLLCDKCRAFIAWLSDRQTKALMRGGEA